MSAQDSRPLLRRNEPAWLGYKDGELVAIELEGFHAGSTVAEWESRGYRVEQVTSDEAMRRWRDEVQQRDREERPS